MKYQIEFMILGLPARTNNAASDWKARMMEARKWKLKVAIAVRPEMRPKIALTKARVTLMRFSSREPDYDGLVSSFKHVLDGLINIDVIQDDKMRNIGRPDYQWHRAPKLGGHIIVKVEEIE